MSLETLINQESESTLNGGLIETMEEIFTPYELMQKYPVSSKAERTVIETRRDIAKILSGEDDRLLILTGPCSIDDVDAAKDYAIRLKKLFEEVKDKALVVMRTYFEKPRSTIGWKGLIYDPDLDDSNKIEKGLETARELLLKINELGIGCATEFLGTLVHPYISDLISYGAIGARTTASASHREFASGLSMPIGIKNATAGSIQSAVDSVIATRASQSYIGTSIKGKIAKIQTNGNRYAHVILRGTDLGPNYDEESVRQALELLEKEGLPKSIVIDASHANSGKDYRRQPEVVREILRQRQTNQYIKGIMLESYLVEGKGKERGQSRTDSCISFETTETLARAA